MDKNSKTLIKEMNELLSKKTPLFENFMMPSDYQDDLGDEGDSVHADDVSQDEQKLEQSSECAPEDIKRIFDGIRKLSLEGVSKLAEHPESEYYDVLKRIWTLTDKIKEEQVK